MIYDFTLLQIGSEKIIKQKQKNRKNKDIGNRRLCILYCCCCFLQKKHCSNKVIYFQVLNAYMMMDDERTCVNNLVVSVAK